MKWALQEVRKFGRQRYVIRFRGQANSDVLAYQSHNISCIYFSVLLQLKVSEYRTLYEPPVILASLSVIEDLGPLDDETIRHHNRGFVSVSSKGTCPGLNRRPTDLQKVVTAVQRATRPLHE